jgi:hypothetical protein
MVVSTAAITMGLTVDSAYLGKMDLQSTFSIAFAEPTILNMNSHLTTALSTTA